MNWNSVGEFLQMGGYGLYVWGSFAVCALVIAAECTGIALRRRALLRLPPDETDETDELQDSKERPLHHEA